LLQKKASPTKDLLHPTAPQTLGLLVADHTEPQGPVPAPHLLLVVMLFETISTHTVTSAEAIERRLAESTANDLFLLGLEAEIKEALSPLLAAAAEEEDMLLENDLQLVVEETTTLNQLTLSQIWLA
jgi:hypothetical protein